MRIVFFGTPDFAVPSLEALAQTHDVVLVVAQPNRPAGRGLKLHEPPVAVKARELGVALLQPAKIRDPQFLDAVASCAPDAGVVVAYGRILPASLLVAPRLGFFNVHASLLPQYRGAAPIQRAIEAGEEETGVTIMRVDEALDHGPILSARRVAIGPDERAPSLAQRLARAGADELLTVMRALEGGEAVETPQDHDCASYADKVEKHEGEARWSDSAATIYNRFRAFDPWPGLFVQSQGETIKLIDLASNPSLVNAEPGKVLAVHRDGSVIVAAMDGAIELRSLQRPGKPRAAAADVARGLGWRVGEAIP
jgi:methionyl-tRNA formyltransferase